MLIGDSLGSVSSEVVDRLRSANSVDVEPGKTIASKRQKFLILSVITWNLDVFSELPKLNLIMSTEMPERLRAYIPIRATWT